MFFRFENDDSFFLGKKRVEQKIKLNKKIIPPNDANLHIS